MLYYWCY